ncbi:MAG: PA14 domain-containing protein, partial [Verrucomicrobiota bacterium]
MQRFKLIFAIGLAFLFCENLSPAAPPTNLVFGSTISGTISEPGEEDAFTFTGALGQRVYYDALDTNFDPIQVRLVSPSGAIAYPLNGNSDSDIGPFSLVEAGPYTLSISGSGSAVGDYSFRLDDLAAAPPLNFGATISGNLSPRSEADLYQLSGKLGQRLHFTSVSASAPQANWRLVGPADQTLVSRNITTDLGDVVLPANGVYVVLVEGAAANPVPLTYQVSVSDVSEPVVAVSGLGADVTGSITAGQRLTNTFSAPAGSLLYFDNLDRSSPALVVEVRDPANAQVFFIGTTVNSGPFFLSRSGTYSLIIGGADGNSTGNYQFRLLDLASTAASLTLNTAVTATLNPAWKTDVYQFTGTAGQRLYFDALDGDADVIQAVLLGPTGSNVHINQRSQNDVGPFTLAASGTYFLFLEGNQTGTGNYSFELWDVASQPALDLNLDQSGSLNPGLSARIFRFTGSDQQRLYFDGKGTNNGGFANLYGPGNEAVASANLVNDFEVALSRNGEYVLVLDGSSPNPAPYSFRLITGKTITNALTLGTLVTGTLAEPGEEHWYAFDGAPGQRLYYDAWDADFDAISARLVSPSGVSMNINGNADSDVGPFTLAEDGVYSLVLNGNGATTGDYRFRLIDVEQPPAKPLTLDTTIGVGLVFVPASALNLTGSYVNKSLRDYAAKDDWRTSQTIAGTRSDTNLNFPSDGWGQRGPVGITGGTDVNWQNFSVQWDGQITITVDGTHLYTRSDDGSRMSIDLNNDGVFEDSGPEFINNNWGNAQGATTGPASVALTPGTYRVRIQYEQGAGAAEMYLLWDGGVSLDPGTRSEIFRFNGAGGQQLFFDGLGPASGGNWSLIGPGNQNLGSANLVNDFEVTLPLTGTYLLVLDGASPNPIPYSFRVIPFATQTKALTLGATVNGMISNPGEQDLYTFRGTAGQRLYYNALDRDFDAIAVRLVSPGGTVVHLSANADSDVGPFTLVEDGNYTLILDGNGSTTGDYSFRLIDVDQAPAKPLTLDTTVGIGLVPVPANALNVTGSYVNKSLRDYATNDDWRISQAIAGTRIDATIDFPTDGWGQRATVGITSGT